MDEYGMNRALVRINDCIHHLVPNEASDLAAMQPVCTAGDLKILPDHATRCKDSEFIESEGRLLIQAGNSTPSRISSCVTKPNKLEGPAAVANSHTRCDLPLTHGFWIPARFDSLSMTDNLL